MRHVLTISVLTLATLRLHAQGRSTRAAFAGHTYRPGIDVVDYDLSIDVPDTGRTLRGRATLTVRHAPAARSLTLDLVRLVVDSVTVGGARAAFTRTDTSLTFPLPRDPETRVSVWYGGRVEDGLIIRTDSAGRWTAFGDNWPNRARYWIPSVDHPSDKATVTWRVRAGKGRVVVANGALEGTSDAPDGRTTTRYREDSPIPVYLMVVAVAPLTRTSLGETACGLAAHGRCVPQAVYTAPEQVANARVFARAAEIVRWFSSLVAPFPYEKLAHLQSSTRFGGMENASAIFYADQPFHGKGTSERTIAHETAHQWFGDAVTEREWPHLWLSEGFATYFAALWTEHAAGSAAFRDDLAAMRRAVIEDTQSVTKHPVIDTIETNLFALLDRNSYEKGGFVLHMLRRLVGDSAFFRGIRRYYAAHANGNALTSDLERVMEASSGTSLRWFFDQWLRRPGYAELRVGWSRDTSGVVRLTIDQSERFGAYRFPLVVAVTDPSGEVRRATVDVPARAHAELRLPGRYETEPRELVLDPDVSLLATFDSAHR